MTLTELLVQSQQQVPRLELQLEPLCRRLEKTGQKIEAITIRSILSSYWLVLERAKQLVEEHEFELQGLIETRSFGSPQFGDSLGC